MTASLLFVPYSTPGHVHPMLPVMAELVAAGVTVRALVGDRFAPMIRATGAAVTVLEAVPDVFVPDGFSGAGRFLIDRSRRPLRNVRAAGQLARELRTHRPDLTVLDPMLGWADRVTRRTGFRSALFNTTFADGPLVRAAIGRGSGRYLPSVRRHSRPGRLVLAHTLLDLQPAAETLPASVHLVGPLIRSDEPEVPPAERDTPLLYVSPGTVFSRAPSFFQGLGAAFEGRPWQVVVATGPIDPARLPPMPANVRMARDLPQLSILRRCSVFLTHAGMNSVMEGLAAGVPMALIPRSAEQRFIADQLVRLGVGEYALLDGHDPARLYVGITELAADPAVRAAAVAWRHQLAGVDGPARAAALLTAEATRESPSCRVG
ncbi:nucleotide disphospho-sugar-binding domain-containing protein [Actinoplanes sp. NPDC051851]|uniref:glycosyltransferase n=1 Tax=Actinoplanes sp. NPDC051851 TaxID=3154753 RepID=UPI0034363795